MVNRAIRDKKPEEITLPFMLENSSVNALQGKISSAERKLSELLIELTPLHPEVIAAQKEIDTLKQDLAETRKAVVAAELESCKIKKKELESGRQIFYTANQYYSAGVNKILHSQSKLFSFQKDIKHRRSVYQTALDKQLKLAGLKERIKNTKDVTVIELARVPSSPIRPNLPLNIVLGLMVGLTIGCGTAIFLPETEPYRPEKKKRIPLRKKAGKERRKMTRLDRSLEVIYSTPEEPDVKHRCLSQDISESGIRLTVDKKIPKSSTIRMQIDIPEAGPVLSGGKIMWEHEVSLLEDGNGPFNVGIKFVDMDSDDEKVLLRYLYENMAGLRKDNIKG
jgi:hypothetical protein